jgi:hypothetical protein
MRIALWIAALRQAQESPIKRRKVYFTHSPASLRTSLCLSAAPAGHANVESPTRREKPKFNVLLPAPNQRYGYFHPHP